MSLVVINSEPALPFTNSCPEDVNNLIGLYLGGYKS